MRKKEKKEDIFSLRRKVRNLKDSLDFIHRLSWRLKEVKDKYDLNSDNPDELFALYQELIYIEDDLHRAYRSQYPSRIEKEA